MNEKTTPIFVILLVVASFAIGSMWTKIQYLQASPNPSTSLGTVTQQQQTPQAAAPQPSATTVSLDKVKALFSDNNIHFGDTNKKVLFVEVSDPSCPFCHFAGGKDSELVEESMVQNSAMSRFKPVATGGTYNAPVEEMRKLVANGQAGFAFVYYPGHGNGELGTQAMYCAFEKGKFWEVHDILMSKKGYEAMNTAKADAAALATLLASAVDKTFMQSCLSSGKYADRISRDTQLVESSLGFDPQKDGTPYFLINTTQVSGAVDYKQAMEPLVKPLL